AVVVVQDRLGGGGGVQSIDREVAAGGVLFLAAEDVVSQDAAVLVGLATLGVLTGAEGGDLDGFRPAHHMHDLEAAADDAGAAEQAADFLRRCAGGHVVVLGRDVGEQ